jgi:hypothetical protein
VQKKTQTLGHRRASCDIRRNEWSIYCPSRNLLAIELPNFMRASHDSRKPLSDCKGECP